MADYLELVKEKEREEDTLYKRMDVDSALLYLEKYIMRDPKGKAIPDIIHSTLNKPAVFGANVVSALGGVREQCIVSSENEAFDTHEVEEFLEAAFAAANASLQKKRMPSLNRFADIQFCFRGRTARRILFREENGILLPDIAEWDGRHIRYEVGDEELEWASYETTRSQRQIEKKYNILISGKQGKVLDVWDTEHNEVWIDERKILEQEHPYGYTPVVVEVVPLGYGDTLLDENRVQNEGESIFFLIRHIVPQLNMVLSIGATLNFLSVKAPQQFASSGGTTAEPPAYEEAIKPGSVTSVELNGGFKRIDFGDAIRAFDRVYNMLEKAFQEGSYTDIDIGNVKQPFSAVALITIGESKDQVYLPRMASKELLNVQSADMIIKQAIQIGGTIELGTLGHKKKFATSKLKGEYSIDYKYFIKSPKIDIARMSIAQAAAQWYPREYIYSEVLQVEDPEGLMEDWYSEMAEKVDPMILKHRIFMGLIKKAEDGDENAAKEAQIMAFGMGMSVAQAKAGVMPGGNGMKPEALPKPLVPMLGPGGEPSSAQQAADLEKVPEEV